MRREKPTFQIPLSLFSHSIHSEFSSNGIKKERRRTAALLEQKNLVEGGSVPCSLT
jgi:hypothetical protein